MSLMICLMTSLVCLFNNTIASAFQEPTPAGSPESLAQMERLVKISGQKLAQAGSYQLTIVSQWKNFSPSGTNEGKNRVYVKSNAPGKFRIEIFPEDAREPKLICVSDGTSVIFHLPATGMFEKHATNDPAAFVRQNPILSQALEGTAVEFLVRSDAVQEGLSQIRDVEYLGQVQGEGGKQHHVKFFFSGKYNVQLWFDSEKDQLIRRLDRRVEVPLKDGLKMVQTISSTLEWKLGEKLEDSLFRYTPPTEAKQTSSIQRALIRGYASIIDQPAPSANFNLLDGTEIKLAEKLSKPTVLFFWATWSVTSLEELPEIKKLIQMYSEKGVQFFGINVGEKPEVVKEFATKAGWTIPVGLDEKSRLADAFDIDQLPAAVLIDGQGKIKAVFSGATAANRQSLQKLLESQTSK